jgi:hypothetical protein
MVAVDASTHSENVQVIRCNFKAGSVERSIHHWSFWGILAWTHLFVIHIFRISMYYSQIKALVDAAIHSEHAQVIKCDFKPGSVERSTDLYQKKKGVPQQATIPHSATNTNWANFPVATAGNIFNLRLPIKIDDFHSGVPLYRVLTILEAF